MQFGVFWTLACTCQAGTGHDESSGRKPCFFLRLASSVDGSCRHFGSLPNGCSCRKWIPDITEAEGYGAMKIIADQVLKDTLINIDYGTVKLSCCQRQWEDGITLSRPPLST